MHLIYMDETGNTGTDLSNPEQPVFVLCALIVPEQCWQTLESDLESMIKQHIPEIALQGGEVHATDLRSGKGAFKNIAPAQRIELRDSWLTVAQKHGLRIVYRAIEKQRFAKWVSDTFGSAVKLHPHVAAFPLVARVVDDYLAQQSGVLGMFISDENHETVRDIEKSIRVLRGEAGALRLKRIVEKGFFIDSRKSRVLQLCDVCAFSLRKMEEVRLGLSVKPADEKGIELVKPLIQTGDEGIHDVLAWLTEQHLAVGLQK